ncbi:ABC transporter permease [Halobacterium bonnevillei]|uniref:ABC transporter permease n=1 Tax=Halobacterium bonnevillei TaxID=2692200 RepID=UPI002D7F28D7|nr:hypothetical protein [Halobacterium bonnevillei]
MDVNLERFDTSTVLDVLKSLYSLILVLVLWEVVTQMGYIHYYFLPPLSDVLARFVELTQSGEMLDNAYLTLKRAFLGLAIASVFGVIVGILSARNRVATGSSTRSSRSGTRSRSSRSSRYSCCGSASVTPRRSSWSQSARSGRSR